MTYKICWGLTTVDLRFNILDVSDDDFSGLTYIIMRTLNTQWGMQVVYKYKHQKRKLIVNFMTRQKIFISSRNLKTRPALYKEI